MDFVKKTDNNLQGNIGNKQKINEHLFTKFSKFITNLKKIFKRQGGEQ